MNYDEMSHNCLCFGPNFSAEMSELHDIYHISHTIVKASTY